MSGEREELAELIAIEAVKNVRETEIRRCASDGETPVFDIDEQIADAILAVGYRKPRTIETVEELEALPVGSVILDIDLDAWQRYSTGWTCTDRAANTVDQPSVNLVNILGPATVLWEPQS